MGVNNPTDNIPIGDDAGEWLPQEPREHGDTAEERQLPQVFWTHDVVLEHSESYNQRKNTESEENYFINSRWRLLVFYKNIRDTPNIGLETQSSFLVLTNLQ